VPKEKRYKELNKQRKQKDRYIEGERIWESPEDDGAERDRRALKEKRQPSAPISKEDGVLQQKRKALIESSRKKGKSIWKGREDEELTVEEFSLQHYETLGYKGHVFNAVGIRSLIQP
jgi:fanconi-associated nuclease 1